MDKTWTIEALKKRIGEEVGVSDWLLIDQAKIDQFAEATGDYQYIHVDVERAQQTPFGGTIAHGFLTLSLMPYLTQKIHKPIQGAAMMINYGCDSLRFLAPVKSGKRIRLRSKLAKLEAKEGGRYLLTHRLVYDIEGEERPALIADWLTMVILDKGLSEGAKE